MRVNTEKHIAEIDIEEYFLPVFDSSENAKAFVKSARENQKARIVIHQCARMLYLADKVCQRGRPALDVLFFMIIAEATAKIIYDFQDQGKSKEYTYKFFKDICDESHKARLSTAFRKQTEESDFVADNYLTLDETIELLYGVRCDVVHRGKYFDNLWLKEKNGDDNTLFAWKNLQFVSPNISTNELRNIMLESVVHGCQRELRDASQNDASR